MRNSCMDSANDDDFQESGAIFDFGRSWRVKGHI